MRAMAGCPASHIVAHEQGADGLFYDSDQNLVLRMKRRLAIYLLQPVQRPPENVEFGPLEALSQCRQI